MLEDTGKGKVRDYLQHKPEATQHWSVSGQSSFTSPWMALAL